jgi:hypothetical protein
MYIWRSVRKPSSLAKRRFIPLPFLISLAFCSSGCGKIWYSVNYLNQPSQSFLGYLITSWLSIDGDGAAGVNVDTSNNAFSNTLNGLNGSLYGVWEESLSGGAAPYEIRAALYNGNSTWSHIDGGLPAIGLNYNSANSGATPTSTVSSGKLYVTWHESDTASNIRALVYNGGSSWTFIDGNTGSGLNFNPSNGAFDAHVSDFSGQPCATWTEQSTSNFVIRVKCYNSGSTWSFIDGGTTLGLNQNNGADYPFLAVYNNHLYDAWQESAGGVTQIRVAQYNGGSSWSFIDGGAPTGINWNPAKNGTGPQLTSCQGKLFASWTENNGIAVQVRVAQYGGGSSWSFIDGGGANGINHNINESAQNSIVVCYGIYLYVSWIESNGIANQVRASAYNGTQWYSVDGNGVNGLNHNSTNSASGSSFGMLNNILYLGWGEGGIGNIRVSVGQ